VRQDRAWKRWGGGGVLLALTVAAAGLTIRDGSAMATQIDAKTIPLQPQVTFVKAWFLTGELQGLRVTEGVDHKTGTLVTPPVLRATLTVTNDSQHQAARLLGGKIEYLDPAGQQIAIAHTSFTFIGIPTNRLDPGMHTSQAIEVPFPPAALKPNGLREVSLQLIYLPGPYQVDTVHVPVALGG
jgi:hypothetical protein